MLNYVCIMGRIAQDLELKSVGSSNTSYCGFAIAVDSGYGENKKTYFIDCTAWRNTAEFICKYFAKGSKIAIQGNLITDTYKGKDGVNRKATRVNVTQADFCESKKAASDSSAPSGVEAPLEPSYSGLSDVEEGLPF